MKKVLKKIGKVISNNILGFIIGSIVFGSIGVYAATTIASSTITYDNSTSGGSSTNVQGAVDELYEMVNKTRYAFGDPETTTDYMTLVDNDWNVFASISGTQKSVCIVKSGKLECFKNNNYTEEITHLKRIFGESNCSFYELYETKDFYCEADDFRCVVTFGNYYNDYGNDDMSGILCENGYSSKYEGYQYSCTLDEDNSVSCYEEG